MTIVLLLKEHTLAQRALDATPLLLAVIGVTAWIGGVGPGLLSVVSATLTFCYYLIPPPDSFRMDLKDVPSLIVFALAALFFCWVSAGLRRSEEALRRAHDQMEAAVLGRHLVVRAYPHPGAF